MQRVVGNRELKLGDVIITAPSDIVSHCGIVAGTTEAANHGRSTTNTDGIYHATSSAGVTKLAANGWSQKYKSSSVFRCRALDDGAPDAAELRQKVADAAVALSARCKYGKTRGFVKSWIGTSAYGVNARGRVYKYLGRLGISGTFITDVFCSEFVTLSYQLAAKGDESANYFIDLDGKHTLPKDLRNWILQRTKANATWQYLGDLQ